MLGEIMRLPEPPFLIVTSRLADERLWAEVLNLGAYDVLAKPFESKEVVRIVSLAWLHWKDRYELPVNPQTLMAAAT
jgi:DNA-binding response OmpR family regulator